MQKAQKKIASPSEFMRQIRPELYSDSTSHVATRTAVSSRLRRVCSTRPVFAPKRLCLHEKSRHSMFALSERQQHAALHGVFIIHLGFPQFRTAGCWCSA